MKGAGAGDGKADDECMLVAEHNSASVAGGRMWTQVKDGLTATWE